MPLGRLPPISNASNSEYYRYGTISNPEGIKVSWNTVYSNCCKETNNMKLLGDLFRFCRYDEGTGENLNTLLEKYGCNKSWCYSYSLKSRNRSWHSASIHFHKGDVIPDELIREYISSSGGCDKRILECCKKYGFEYLQNKRLRTK